MDFTELKAKLNTRLGDNDDFAFSSDEKTEILTEAIQDSYVTVSAWDDTLSFSQGVWQYELPDEITSVKDVYIKSSSNVDPETITLPWDVVDRNLQFKGGSRVIPDGSTIYIRGNYKYTTEDTIEETQLQQYILNLAQVNAMDEIGIKKILKFVKNDTSVSEILAVKNGLERKLEKHRSSLPKEFQSA